MNHVPKKLKQLGRGLGLGAGLPIRRTSTPVSRNAACPCGSGRKYKHCCWQLQTAVNESRADGRIGNQHVRRGSERIQREAREAADRERGQQPIDASKQNFTDGRRITVGLDPNERGANDRIVAIHFDEAGEPVAFDIEAPAEQQMVDVVQPELVIAVGDDGKFSFDTVPVIVEQPAAEVRVAS